MNTSPPRNRFTFLQSSRSLALFEFSWSRQNTERVKQLFLNRGYGPHVARDRLRTSGDMFNFDEVLGFRVQGSGFRVQGSGFMVQGSVSRVKGSGFMVMV